MRRYYEEMEQEARKQRQGETKGSKRRPFRRHEYQESAGGLETGPVGENS